MSTENPSYLNSTLNNSIIVGVGLSVLSIIVTYVSISGEPSGSMFSPLQFAQVGICLFAAIAGVLSVKAYAGLENADVSIGKGAVIGLVAAVITSITTTLISYIWNGFVDPTLMDNVSNYMVTNMEMAFSKAGMAADQMDQILGDMEKSMMEQKTFIGMLKGFGFSLLGFGIVNLIAGMITAKVLGKDSE